MRNQIFIFSLLISFIISNVIRDNIQRVKENNHQKFLDEFQKNHEQVNLRKEKNHQVFLEDFQRHHHHHHHHKFEGNLRKQINHQY